MSLNIQTAYDDIDSIRELFREYTAMLGVDLSFQNYDEELAGLPGKYAPPDGRLFIARYEGRVAGCVALRRYDAGTCEMKRLFVRPEFRNKKIGLALIERVVAAAREAGYEAMVLDTLSTLENSVALYRRYGFQSTPPYYHNPHPDAVYFRLPLGSEQA